MKPDFFEDEDLAEHPFWVRLLFEGLWCLADREGRLEDRPLKIKAQVFPYDKVSTEVGLSALAEPKKHSPKHEPFIVRYEVNGDKYIQILNFHKHQHPHQTEKESLIPPFNGELNVKDTLNTRCGKDAVMMHPSHVTDNHIQISFIDFKWEGIGEGDRAAWAKAYPACDIDVELRRMAEWLKANPTKIKSNYRRFITNWLSRTQDRGGTNTGTKSGKPSNLDIVKDWAATRGIT